ncbi:hypothetical protein Btru_061588, partial [Bulinus truncatus]
MITYRITTYGMTTDGMASDIITTDDMASDIMTTDDMASDIMTTNSMTTDGMTADVMTTDVMTTDFVNFNLQTKMMHNKKESLDVAVLREKIRIKKIDRKVYVDEMERVVNGNREKRNALRIGNDCLRFMTRRQNNMTRAINTKIFESRPNSEKLPMMKCDLTTSIVKNDNKLFKYGKRLMKQDYKREQREYLKKFQEEELARAVEEKVRSEEEFHRECESFLSQQVRVEESKNRLVSAKLVYKNLQKVLAELDKNLMEYPFKIKEIEDKIIERKKEVNDFLELKAGALRFLDIEETQLGPLNEELKIVNAHFEKIIGVKKQELDDRRKNNSLGKFLAERETHGFNFTGSS